MAVDAGGPALSGAPHEIRSRMKTVDYFGNTGYHTEMVVRAETLYPTFRIHSFWLSFPR
jgi:hypothetical protein